MEVRLLGRLIVRERVDHGTAVLTSSGFPNHVVKHRRLSDLLSHERDYSKKSLHQRQTRALMHTFYSFFRRTELESIKPELVKSWSCVASINGFSITSLITPGSPDSMSYLGEALYLNASRFNHSCKPSLVFSFNGCQLVVKYIDRDAKSISEKPITKKEFKNLTFNYGYGTSWNYGCSFSLTRQRIDSLEARYFFRCRCELCRDRKLNQLQTHSAPVECSKCRSPYVWRFRTTLRTNAKLVKTCRCPSNTITDDQKSYWSLPEVRKCAMELNDKWSNVMEATAKLDDCEMLLNSCEPFRLVACQYWNNSYNARLAQMCEKVFEAYWMKLYKLRHAKSKSSGQQSEASSVASTESVVMNSEFQQLLQTTLQVAEIMINVYVRYWEPYNLSKAIFCHRIGTLYRLRHDQISCESAAYYFLAASEVWKLYGDEGCQKYFQQMSARVLARVKLEPPNTFSMMSKGPK